jgi:ribosomal protein L37AE/L43A
MKKLTNSNLGAKYGLAVRKQYIKYYNSAHNTYSCNYCNYLKPTVTREFAGVWNCKKCKITFVGYAYHPYTDK